MESSVFLLLFVGVVFPASLKLFEFLLNRYGPGICRRAERCLRRSKRLPFGKKKRSRPATPATLSKRRGSLVYPARKHGSKNPRVPQRGSIQTVHKTLDKRLAEADSDLALIERGDSSS